VAKKKKILKAIEEEEDKIDEAMIAKEQKFIKKAKLYFGFHMDNYGSKHGIRLEGTLFFLNFLAIALFVADTYTLPDMWQKFVRISEFAIVSVFVVEYGVRMWVAKRKVKHFFSLYSLIDLISIIPVLTAVINLAFLRIFRILRLFRLLRVLRFQRVLKQKNTMFGVLTDTQIILTRIGLGVFTIIFVYSGFIWAIESRVNPEAFATIWSAMYFSIVTLSTVGYGDITPLSPLGRIVTVAMILTGITVIPWQLGKLLKVLIVSSGKLQYTCKKCKLQNHEPDATHCRKCGTKLKRKIIPSKNQN